MKNFCQVDSVLTEMSDVRDDVPPRGGIFHEADCLFWSNVGNRLSDISAPPRRAWPGWIAVLLLPALALLARNQVRPWIFMWAMCSAIFLDCKWLTYWQARKRNEASRIRTLAYFFAWPGMDAKKFLGPVRERRLPSVSSFLFAIAKALFGALLLFVVARRASAPLLAGWIGMIGLLFSLHFGLFHLLAIAWRSAGVEVDPIMNAPWRAASLSEFWGRRWNAAFNRLALDYVFRPLLRSTTVTVATLGAFLVSGLVHESVISLPAHAGYGLPTAYFVLQGGGLLVERSVRKIRGHTFTFLVTAAPAFWLFHPPFVRGVILPFMQAIRAL